MLIDVAVVYVVYVEWPIIVYLSYMYVASFPRFETFHR